MLYFRQVMSQLSVKHDPGCHSMSKTKPLRRTLVVMCLMYRCETQAERGTGGEVVTWSK